MEGRLGQWYRPVDRLQRTCLLFRHVRFAGYTTCRAKPFLKMLVGLLCGQMLIDAAAQHPAGLMAKLFHLSERRIDWRAAGAIPFLCQQGYQFVELLLRLR